MPEKLEREERGKRSEYNNKSANLIRIILEESFKFVKSALNTTLKNYKLENCEFNTLQFYILYFIF